MLLRLINVEKTYHMGETVVRALDRVSLEIAAGDFVAIMGPSGSGKSTLMHVLGLLDLPDAGTYTLANHDVARLSAEDVAKLRRDTVGFVFQQFHLLPRMSAADNVALPLLYSEHRADRTRAYDMLARVHLAERAAHTPSELSGGQQQRVAIARALMNHPRIIFADEPTGNLDSHSGQEILALLHALNEEGITIILVTHEEAIGRAAARIIRMRDGKIQSDERQRAISPRAAERAATSTDDAVRAPHNIAPRAQKFSLRHFVEHFRQGITTLLTNKIRAGLSMLGILIGVAAVVAMLALGRGAQTVIEAQLASLGSNLLMLRPGSMNAGGVQLGAGAVTRLSIADAEQIKQQIPGVHATDPTVWGHAQITYRDKNWGTDIQGVMPTYATMRASTPDFGWFFTDDDNQQRKRVAVLGLTVVRALFATDENPIGAMIKLNKVNFQVIGVMPEKGATSWRDQDDVVAIPLNTAMHRLLGRDYIDYIDVEMEPTADMSAAQTQIRQLMFERHRIPLAQQQDAFPVRDMADVKATLAQSSHTMSLLLACVATISLLVGGIGIMNIMLVSVTERTREIGLRKAIGATRRDILTQFLIEAVAVSVVGGVAGICTGWIITTLLAAISGWATIVTFTSILLAFGFSALIGVSFGVYPARKAAELNPIEALRYE